jgi:hypothetical protein
MNELMILLQERASVLQALRNDPSLLLEGALLASGQDWEEGAFVCRPWSAEEIAEVMKTVSALLPVIKSQE